MLNLQVVFVQRVVQSDKHAREKSVADQRILIAKVDLSEPPKTGRPRDAPLRRKVTITEGVCTRNKGTALKRLTPRLFRRVLHK
jgi:hypothetical protein